MEPNYRDYTNCDSKVEITYRLMLENQTYLYVEKIKKQIESNNYIEKNILEIFNLLDELIDESDPDNDMPQIHHAYQTSEAILNMFFEKDPDPENLIGFKLKNIPIKDLDIKDIDYLNYKYIHELYPTIKDFSFLILVGLIHDLGKILLLKEFGEFPQWSTVGDTFPVGINYSKNCVFYEKGWQNHDQFIKKDLNYVPQIGFDNMTFSFGHDEYLAKVLELSNTLLPKEAIYMIRYHSFYPWHTPKNNNLNNRGYKEYASDLDKNMLPLLKILQKADLYSKSKNLNDFNDIRVISNVLINKYIPDKLKLLTIHN